MHQGVADIIRFIFDRRQNLGLDKGRLYSDTIGQDLQKSLPAAYYLCIGKMMITSMKSDYEKLKASNREDKGKIQPECLHKYSSISV